MCEYCKFSEENSSAETTAERYKYQNASLASRSGFVRNARRERNGRPFLQMSLNNEKRTQKALAE